MSAHNEKQKIIEHYQTISPYYRQLWGEHLHHGYWATGAESKEEAQLALTTYLAEAAQIQDGSEILDVGCGFGGSSIHLAARYRADVIGITISTVQAAMARQTAERLDVAANFLVMDADNLALSKTFDVVWSIEAISHFADKAGFFARAAELLKPEATMALIDWFKADNERSQGDRSSIERIERGMLVELKTIPEYVEMIRTAGLNVTRTTDISANCAKTWDISLDLIKSPALWRLARKRGADFVRFLRSFNAMRKGFASGGFVYGMIIAKRQNLD